MRRKRFVWFAAALVLLLAACCTACVHTMRYKMQTVDVSVSPDGAYTLTLFSVGEPQFPFGSARGRIVLTEDTQTLCETQIELACDGAQIGRENWFVLWQEDRAVVTLSACEQRDECRAFYFDGRTERLPQLPDQSEPPAAVSFEKREEAPETLQMDVVTNDAGEILFAISADDLIANYNEVCARSNLDVEMTALSQWTQFQAVSPYEEYDADCHLFSCDAQNWLEPTISLYLPQNAEGVYEIELSFNEHGYQEALYQRYMQMCFCMLSAVLPQMDEEQIRQVYDTLYEQMNVNYWGDYAPRMGEERPAIDAMYRCGNVGAFGYYGAGTENICIVALMQEAAQ